MPGVVSARQLHATVDTIAAVQHPDGNLPWTPGGHTDPWNLVEAAMALDVGGRRAEAERAYEWLAARQRPDGAWHAYYLGTEVEDPTLDTNFTSYVATGAWHHYLATGDDAFLSELWSTVERAIDFVLAHQRVTGELAWRGDNPAAGALLTGSSSIHMSLRCAIAIAERLGTERPDWELSLAALAVAIAHRGDVFLDKDRWAMDWYYPILCGVLRGTPARARVAAGWERFVVDGRGVRCVADRPWVTAAETCECAIALDAAGLGDEARRLFAWVQFLRADGGGYWTGANFEGERFRAEGEVFPREQPSWNAAAVVLATDALGGTGATAGLFRGDGLPLGLSPDELIAAGAAIEAERSRARD